MERELKVLYDDYVEKFRNLQYLESELEVFHKQMLEKKRDTERALKKMQKKFRDEDLRILRGENLGSVTPHGTRSAVFQGEEDDLDLGIIADNGTRSCVIISSFIAYSSRHAPSCWIHDAAG